MRQEEGPNGPRGAMRPEVAEAHDRSRNVGRLARKRIGTHLRALYEDVLRQPVPDRFSDLIARLDDEPDGERSGQS